MRKIVFFLLFNLLLFPFLVIAQESLPEIYLPKIIIYGEGKYRMVFEKEIPTFEAGMEDKDALLKKESPPYTKYPLPLSGVSEILRITPFYGKLDSWGSSILLSNKYPQFEYLFNFDKFILQGEHPYNRKNFTSTNLSLGYKNFVLNSFFDLKKHKFNNLLDYKTNINQISLQSQILDTLNADLKFYLYHQQSNLWTPQDLSGQAKDLKDGFVLKGNYSLNPSNQILSDISYFYERFEDKNLQYLNVFLGDVLSFNDKFNFKVGLNYFYNSDNDKLRYYPLVWIYYFLTPQFQIYSGYEEIYRPVDFNSLYVDSPLNKVNNSLKGEDYQNVSMGTKYELSPACKLDFSIKQSQIENYQILEDNGLYGEYLNLKKTDILSFNLGVEYQINKYLSNNFSYIYQNIDRILPYHPHNLFNNVLNFKYKNINCRIDISAFGPRSWELDSDQKIGGYTTVGLDCSFSPFENFEFFVHGENINAKKYEYRKNYFSEEGFWLTGITLKW